MAEPQSGQPCEGVLISEFFGLLEFGRSSEDPGGFEFSRLDYEKGDKDVTERPV
jgi:hypothetical protein